MQFKVTCLVSGSNGTGHAAMLSLETPSRSEEGLAVIAARVLINAGECTQRFCADNQIKLSKVQCIFFSSLAPHNVSGLAGIFLCLSDLGLAKLTLIGPPGLRGLVDLMTPFTNRKYPELTVVEVGASTTSSPDAYACAESTSSSSEEHATNAIKMKTELVDIGELLDVHVLPIRAAEPSSTSAIALAAVFSFDKYRRLFSSSSSTVHVASTSSLAVLSSTRHFRSSPSLDEQCAWAAAFPYPPSVALFAPLSAGSSIPRAMVQKSLKLLRSTVALCFDMETRSDVVELKKAQERLLILNALCPSLFAMPLEALREEFARLQASKVDNEGKQERKCVEEEASAKEWPVAAIADKVYLAGEIVQAEPLLTIVLPECCGW